MENNGKDLISIIIPVYNVEAYLDRCMQTILGQTYSTVEIILVDDGSEDGSAKMCDAYALRDPRVKVIHQENKGLSAARNAGTKASSGAYICYVDPDDEVDTRYVEVLHDAICTYDVPLAMCSYTAIFERDHESELCYPCERAMSGEEPEVFFVTADEYVRNFVDRKHFSVTAWSRMYAADLAKKVLFPEGRVFEDWASHLNFAICAEKIAMVKQSLYIHYKQREDSITDTFSNKNIKDFLWAYQTSYDQIVAYSPESAERARWIINEAPLIIMVNISLKRTERIDSAVKKELQREIKKWLRQGTYGSPKVRIKALMVLYLPGMVPFLWKSSIALRRKNK